MGELKLATPLQCDTLRKMCTILTTKEAGDVIAMVNGLINSKLAYKRKLNAQRESHLNTTNISH